MFTTPRLTKYGDTILRGYISSIPPKPLPFKNTRPTPFTTICRNNNNYSPRIKLPQSFTRSTVKATVPVQPHIDHIRQPSPIQKTRAKVPIVAVSKALPSKRSTPPQEKSLNHRLDTESASEGSSSGDNLRKKTNQQLFRFLSLLSIFPLIGIPYFLMKWYYSNLRDQLLFTDDGLKQYIVNNGLYSFFKEPLQMATPSYASCAYPSTQSSLTSLLSSLTSLGPINTTQNEIQPLLLKHLFILAKLQPLLINHTQFLHFSTTATDFPAMLKNTKHLSSKERKMLENEIVKNFHSWKNHNMKLLEKIQHITTLTLFFYLNPHLPVFSSSLSSSSSPPSSLSSLSPSTIMTTTYDDGGVANYLNIPEPDTIVEQINHTNPIKRIFNQVIMNYLFSTTADLIIQSKQSLRFTSNSTLALHSYMNPKWYDLAMELLYRRAVRDFEEKVIMSGEADATHTQHKINKKDLQSVSFYTLMSYCDGLEEKTKINSTPSSNDDNGRADSIIQYPTATPLFDVYPYSPSSSSLPNSLTKSFFSKLSGWLPTRSSSLSTYDDFVAAINKQDDINNDFNTHTNTTTLPSSNPHSHDYYKLASQTLTEFEFERFKLPQHDIYIDATLLPSPTKLQTYLKHTPTGQLYCASRYIASGILPLHIPTRRKIDAQENQQQHDNVGQNKLETQGPHKMQPQG